jgi:hypothetical protein
MHIPEEIVSAVKQREREEWYALCEQRRIERKNKR